MSANQNPSLTKVAFLIGSLGTGGAERQLRYLIDNLDRSRFVPSLILFDSASASAARNVVPEVYSLGIDQERRRFSARGWRAALAIAQLARILADTKPDVLHAYLPAACIFAAAASMFFPKTILVASRRSLVDCYRLHSRLQAWADHVATTRFDFVTGNSEAVTFELRNLDGLPQSRTATIYNGVDTESFYPNNGAVVKLERGWSPDQLLVGMIANFLPYKRHIDFVRAARIIADHCQQARFVLIGEDRGTLGATLDLIRKTSLEDRFTIIPGTQHPEQWYPALDVCLLTSETEGFSNVVLEAMSCAVSVVASDVGGASEAIEHGFNGFVFPRHRPEVAAQLVRNLLNDESLRKRVAHAARTRCLDHFSVMRMVESYERLYCRLMRMDADRSRTLWDVQES